MRRRIRSDSELKQPTGRPQLSNQSKSVNHQSGPKNMHLLLQNSYDQTGSERHIPLQFNSSTHNIGLSPSHASSVNCGFDSSRLSPTIHEGSLLCGITPRDNSNNNYLINDGPLCPGRPTSLSSVTSSRTSRGSDYFSSSSSGDNHQQLTSHSLGTQFDLPPDVADVEGVRLQKVVEIDVEEEEEEEGFVDDESCAIKDTSDENKKVESPQIPRKKPQPGVSEKDINKRLGAIDHLSPIAPLVLLADPHLTYVDRIILELLGTERMFVRALEDVLAGYMLALKTAKELPITSNDVEKLFGNIKDIYAFNRKFLSFLENCERDPVKISRHFVSKDISFNAYTEYCTNYPISVAILTRCMKNAVLNDFFKNQQAALRHNLPLGSYLLKPVQRILKYHLILQELVKHCDEDVEDYWIIEKALATMTYVAHHINEMKRKHEDAVHIQEIQSLLTNWQGNDLTTYGELVLEGDLKLQGAKNERLVFLYDKMILITKRREDGFLVCKKHIMCSELVLLESIKENPLSFLISPFDSTLIHTASNNSSKKYILTCKTMEDKKMWTHHIKRLIIKNHHTAIPPEAQQSIMNMDTIGLGLDDTISFANDAQQKRSRHSNISLEEGKRHSFKRFGSTISSSSFTANQKPRRRSDSASRKGHPLKALRRKHDNDISDDVSSDSVPNTPTANSIKPRFSFSRRQQSTSPRPEIVENVVEPAPEVNRETSSKEENKKPAEKSERYKQSVIYRRHKRRTSQPVTNGERRLSIRIPTDEEQEGGKNSYDVTLEDFESAEDFLSYNIDNTRESVSWDIQIVEAVFERFKREKSQKESNDDINSDAITSLLIPMPRRPRVFFSSDSSDDDECFTEQSNKSLNNINATPQTSNRKSTPPLDNVASAGEVKVAESNTNKVSEVSSPTLNSDTSQTPCLIVGSDHNQNLIKVDLKTASIADEDLTSPDGMQSPDPKEASRGSSSESRSMPKIKRSLSTQSTNLERKKYFERLKEIRDRRQLNLGSDAKTIQTGLVREMIEQHRECINSQMQQRGGINHSAHRINSSSQAQTNKASVHPKDCSSESETHPTSPVTSPPEYKYGPVVLRRSERSAVSPPDSTNDETNLKPLFSQKNLRKTNHRSLDLETIKQENNSRFSVQTTASLPLNFTSSSSTGNCSSNEEFPDNDDSASPKYKNLLQTQMRLWRSYSEEDGPYTRRSRNLVIESSSPEVNGQGNRKSSRRSQSESKFRFKDLGAISTCSDSKTDKMSEQVDDIWNHLESTEKVAANTPSFDELPTEDSMIKVYNPIDRQRGTSLGPETQTSKTTDSSNLNEEDLTTTRLFFNATPDNNSRYPPSCPPSSPTVRNPKMGKERGRRNVEKTGTVMMLAKRFENASSRSAASVCRSHSVGSNKTFRQLRRSTSSMDKVDFKDVKKQLKSPTSPDSVKNNRSMASSAPNETNIKQSSHLDENCSSNSSSTAPSLFSSLTPSDPATSLPSLVTSLNNTKVASSRSNVAEESPLTSSSDSEPDDVNMDQTKHNLPSSDFVARFCKV